MNLKRWLNQRTNDESREKGIDPSHDDCLWHNHAQVALHHAHHALHHRGVVHGVSSIRILALLVFQKLATVVCRDKIVLARTECGFGDGIGVRAEVDAAL